MIPRRSVYWQSFLIAFLLCLSIAMALYEVRQLVFEWFNTDKVAGNEARDFGVYYRAAKAFFIHNQNPYDLEQIRIQEGFMYPPPSLLLFLPFTFLRTMTAFIVFVGCSYLILLVTIYLILKTFVKSPMSLLLTLAIYGVAMTLGPSYMNATFGQVNIFALMCCVGFVALVERDKPIWGGVVLALGCWIKVYPALLLLIGLRDARYRRACLGVAVGGIAIAVVLLPIIPISVYEYYFREVLPLLSKHITPHIMNQSIMAILIRSTMTLEGMHSYLAMEVSWGLRAVSTGFGAVVLGGLIGAYLKSNTEARRLLGLALILAVIPMIVPLGWGYTYVLALPLIVLCLARAFETQSSIGVMLIVLGSVLALIAPSYHEFGFLGKMPRIIQNLVYARYFLATVALGAIGIKFSKETLVSAPVN